MLIYLILKKVLKTFYKYDTKVNLIDIFIKTLAMIRPIYLHRGKLKRAVEVYEALIDFMQREDDYNAFLPLVCNFLAHARLRLNEPLLAKECLETAMKLDLSMSEKVITNTQLIRVFAALGERPPKAIVDFIDTLESLNGRAAEQCTQLEECLDAGLLF